MRVCLIGKYPPIQGGVSARTYGAAQALAKAGHDVFVVTNAADVRPPYRMLMRAEDWDRCTADYAASGGGRVEVRWTDRADAAQFHIPMSPAYATKLASLAIDVCGAEDIDVIYAFYMEPYGIAGHMAAEATGIPLVVKTAGSDAGRLWRQPQFAPLYDHVFRNAARIVAGGALRDRLCAIGVPSRRIRPDPDYTVDPQLFSPDAEPIDLAEVVEAAHTDPAGADLVWGGAARNADFIGVYGKLGETKGTFALLDAAAACRAAGRDVNLLVMGHGRPRSRRDFRSAVRDLGLEDRVLQIPFLPHWRVPSFIARCEAVCCLEQDFPIAAHGPVAPREVLLSGTPLIASLEMIGKLPDPHRLINGYNCVAVRDVHQTQPLAAAIESVLRAPALARQAAGRGRQHVLSAQARMAYPDRLIAILESAADDGPSAGEDILAHGPSPSGPAARPAASCLDGSGAARDYETLATALEAPPAATAPLDALVFRFSDETAFFDRDRLGDYVPQITAFHDRLELGHDGNALLASYLDGLPPPPIPQKPSTVMIGRGTAFGGRAVTVLEEPVRALLQRVDGRKSLAELIAETSAAGNEAVADTEALSLSLFEHAVIGLSTPAAAYGG